MNQYKNLMRVCRAEYEKAETEEIHKAFDFLLNCFDEKDKYYGEHLVVHSAQFAKMVVRELGLDPVAVMAALVSTCVTIKNIDIKLISQSLGKRLASILTEWKKISNLDVIPSQSQAENMRNLILTLSSDFRVILLKIAWQLYLMRIIDRMEEKQQIQLASEGKFIYSPLAHRLGLYTMMSEMDDIAMRILETEPFEELSKKLEASSQKRNRFIREFIRPIEEALIRNKIKAEIKGRPKSISSIWRKMVRQKIEFEEVFDKFAIRIIINTTPKREKADCWRVYSIITDLYQPNPNRLRDWISIPKSNGYESLHTTVVVPGGEWVEVQIRTERMNEIAEKGLAAHWKYKGIKGQAGIDQWLEMVRQALEQSEMDPSYFMDDLKLSQYNREIFVFTPNGDLKKFPEGASILDFAFDIHSDVGASCVGAKVNGMNVPIRYLLKNGDKIEILRSKNQKPKLDWLNFVVTSKAKTKIKLALKEEKLKEAEEGKEILKRRFKNWKIEYNDATVRKVLNHFKYKDAIDLYYDIAREKVDLLLIKELFTEKAAKSEQKTIQIDGGSVDKLLQSKVDKSGDFLVIDNRLDNVEYKLAKCCNPIPGDDIFGFVTIHSGITIHRMNCPNAQQLISKYGYRIIKARWSRAESGKFFSVSLRITGMDELGIVSNISDVISKDLRVNMRSISIESNDGMFEGTITLFIKDTGHLEALMKKLRKVRGILSVKRLESH
ncbi:MAG: bifunctional (p)ppGpp synthetase/guanosine-3',5'-bis(diphosphate) 3'-pyrophosphohydrolase [Bacteroidales bacterium]|nr:bifunctional (p)ppGpp synthetase/guanosine-3',5'-bis(diphosphate) 3'-pyrophosphohydrolase [Bacteroidales bacterium]